MRAACHYCGTTDADMRPYGPGGSPVCFPCATGTPEREAATFANFAALAGAAVALSPDGIVALTPNGPQPVVDIEDITG